MLRVYDINCNKFYRVTPNWSVQPAAKYIAVYCGLIATGTIFVCGDGKIIHTAGKGVVRMCVLRDDEHSSIAV